MSAGKFLDLVKKGLMGQPQATYLDAESQLGRQLFGPIPEGVQREFFHGPTKNVWLWYENGQTTRYEVRPQGVFKRVGASPFAKLGSRELENFRLATRQYLTSLKTHLYK